MSKRFKVNGTLFCGVNRLQSFGTQLTIIIKNTSYESNDLYSAIKLYMPGFTLKGIVSVFIKTRSNK